MPPPIRESEIPEDVLEAAVERRLAERREARDAERTERRDVNRKRPRQPARSRHAALTSGAYVRRQKPVSAAEDRAFVPGALYHWRTVNGLNHRDAQARIGYSPRSSVWRQWEDGMIVPSYETLLRIITATGLGYLATAGAKEAPSGVAPDTDGSLLLDASRAAHEARKHRRRLARKARQPR